MSIRSYADHAHFVQNADARISAASHVFFQVVLVVALLERLQRILARILQLTHDFQDVFRHVYSSDHSRVRKSYDKDRLSSRTSNRFWIGKPIFSRPTPVSIKILEPCMISFLMSTPP